MHLQPSQYASWLKKAHDPEWTEHRYRTAQDRAMVSAILDLETALARIAELEAALKDSATIHSNILRGDIALTKEQAIHIAGLPADIEQQLALMCQPVSDEEWDEGQDQRYMTRDNVNSLIISRAEGGSDDK
jgi:hypothetical protein